MIHKYFIVLTLLFLGFQFKAQDPNWSVNSANYQYSMTFTAFLNVNGTALTSTNDKVGAFINGELRGVASVVYVSSADKYVVFLSVFANTNGETISFKIYNSTSDAVVDALPNENFNIDGNLGGIFQSYSIASPALNNDAILSSFGFAGITSVSQTIVNYKIDVLLPVGSDISALVAEYSISNGAIFFIDKVQQVSGVSVRDFTNTVVYQLMSENEAKLIEYEVTVTIESVLNDAPELVLMSDADFFVKQAPLTIDLQTSMAVLDFSVSDVLVTNAVVLSLDKINDTNYALKISPIQQGNFSIEIPVNVVSNSQGLGNLASNKLNFSYDIINPYILSIKRKNPSNEITTNDMLEFTVLFSEAVDNLSVSDFVSVSNATFVLIKETDAKYILRINNIATHNGAVSLNIKSTNTIQDKASNLLLNSVFNPRKN